MLPIKWQTSTSFVSPSHCRTKKTTSYCKSIFSPAFFRGSLSLSPPPQEVDGGQKSWHLLPEFPSSSHARKSLLVFTPRGEGERSRKGEEEEGGGGGFDFLFRWQKRNGFREEEQLPWKKERCVMYVLYTTYYSSRQLFSHSVLAISQEKAKKEKKVL